MVIIKGIQDSLCLLIFDVLLSKVINMQKLHKPFWDKVHLISFICNYHSTYFLGIMPNVRGMMKTEFVDDSLMYLL